MKCTTLLVLSFITHISIGQSLKKIVKYYDKDSALIKETFYYNPKLKKIDSLYVSYYHSGSKKSEGMYKNDQMTGPWKYYYENSSLKAEGTYEKNKQNGPWKYYFENGSLNMEGVMLNGKKHEHWKTFYENNTLKSEGNYVNGKQDGNWNYYAETGEKKGVATLSNGNGEYNEFFDNGNIKVNGYIKNGISDSLWTYYYPDGNIKSEGYERSGQKAGEWKSFYPNGTVAESGAYKDGKPVGSWKYFHENGKMSAEGEHKEGEKQGKWSYYYDTGELKGESMFVPSSDGDFKEYYPNGKLKSQGKVRNGKNSGHWEYFYETGEKEGEADYENGSGQYTGYYPDGTKKMEGRVIDGTKVGTWTLYDEKGVATGKYINIEGKEEQDKTQDFETQEPLAADAVSTKDTSTIVAKPKPKNTNKKNVPKRRSRDYKSFIVALNPMPVFLPINVNNLPVYLEYYIEKKVGYELQYAIMRYPFFSNHQKQDLRQNYASGYSITFKNKFYRNPVPNRGMWYMAYDVRYINLNQSILLEDTNTLKPYEKVKNTAQQRGFEVTLQFGDRFMKMLDKPGITFDMYIGLGLRCMQTLTTIKQEPLNIKFAYSVKDNQIGTWVFSPAPRLGFNVGYLF